MILVPRQHIIAGKSVYRFPIAIRDSCNLSLVHSPRGYVRKAQHIPMKPDQYRGPNRETN